ncbi:MAG: glutamyl-tRNA reductase [Thioalkalivibrio sp.]|nr:glutamyl-tRNA reductase [Thioalkalivibrio sp.]
MLFTLGINHRTAPVQVRERLAVNEVQLGEALDSLHSGVRIPEAAILSTCNRTEIYFRENDHAGEERVLDWLGGFHGIRRDELEAYLYRHHDDEAVLHTLRVACGLDSMVLGEPQILGQMKSAYQHAHSAGTLGLSLERLFQHAFATAKDVRTSTAIGASAISVAFAAVSLARQIFGDLKPLTALVIGAGETIELTLRHLVGHGVGHVIVANRTVERAHMLGDRFGAEPIPLTGLPEYLHRCDIVISSTAAPLPILGKGAVERAIRRRRHRPMFMVDIAVPRDIEPEVAELEDVYLYTVDDLQEVISQNMASRQAAAEQAEQIIAARADEFMRWLRARDSVESIRRLRDQAETIQRETLLRAETQLRAGHPPEDVLRQLAHLLTNRLMHAPCKSLNAAAHEGDADLLRAAHRLFQLPGSDDADTRDDS